MLAAELSLASKSKDSLFTLGTEANAHVGSVPSTALGSEETQEENENGAALRSTAKENGLLVLNTFFQAGTTWTGSGGHRSRIDYLCVSPQLKTIANRCWVSLDIDLAT